MRGTQKVFMHGNTVFGGDVCWIRRAMACSEDSRMKAYMLPFFLEGNTGTTCG
ncbi:unnamed protein product, partial [Ectocarpus fasciculatus]